MNLPAQWLNVAGIGALDGFDLLQLAGCDLFGRVHSAQYRAAILGNRQLPNRDRARRCTVAGELDDLMVHWMRAGLLVRLALLFWDFRGQHGSTRRGFFVGFFLPAARLHKNRSEHYRANTKPKLMKHRQRERAAFKWA